MLETSWTQKSNKTMENTYNAEGKRVAKAVDGGKSVRYFYEYNDVVFEYVNGGAVTVFNVIGTNLISSQIDPMIYLLAGKLTYNFQYYMKRYKDYDQPEVGLPT